MQNLQSSTGIACISRYIFFRRCICSSLFPVSDGNINHFSKTKKSISNFAGPLDRYAEIDDEVDVEQCSDSEAATRRNIERQRQTPPTSLASPPPCASDDERLTPEQIPVHFHS